MTIRGHRVAVTVVGQGFSGLVAAWSLARAGFQVTVRSDSSAVGGMIASVETTYGLVETAANGMLSSSLVEELFFDCGVEVQIPKKSSRRRYLLVNSEISRFPLSIFEAIHTFFKLLKIKKNPPKALESVDEWGRRALGVAITDKVLSVATLGIFASPGHELSATLISRRFYRSRPRVFGDRKQKYRGTISVRGGLGVLLQALHRRLKNLGVIFDFTESAEPSKSSISSALRADLAAGRVVVFAIPAWSAVELLKTLRKDVSSIDGRLDERVEALSQVDAVPLISVTVFFRERPRKIGFGTLFSQSPICGEADGILGALQNSEIFEGRAAPGVHSETWILGGMSRGQKLLEMTDKELEALVVDKRTRHIDSRTEQNVLEVHIARWPRALPHYSPQLEKQVPILKRDSGGIVLFGNYLGDLGLSSILESSMELPSRVAGLSDWSELVKNSDGDRN